MVLRNGDTGRMLWLCVVLLLALNFSLFGLAYVIRSHDLAATASRHQLCEQNKHTNESSRQLWLRVIARSPKANPAQVEKFKHDLFELFPIMRCPE